MKLTLLIVAVWCSAPLAAAAQGAAAAGGGDSITVRPQPDVTLLMECSQALSTQDGSAKAIQACKDAVAAADAAGADAYEPRAARSVLGDVYMFAKRWSDAITSYQAALAIKRPSDASDRAVSEILVKMGLAYVNVGDIGSAERSVESAVPILDAAMVARPDQRAANVDALKGTLHFLARLKAVRGNASTAQALERRALALDATQ